MAFIRITEDDNEIAEIYGVELETQMMSGGSAIIELSKFETKSRNPETLTLSKDCFDWFMIV